MKRELYFLLLLISLSYACKQKTKTLTSSQNKAIDSFKVYTHPSRLDNDYLHFNSPDAINTIANIENAYFNDYNNTVSNYYGTQWYYSVGQRLYSSDSSTVFEHYASEQKTITLDSMHCTIYAVKALESGFGTTFENIKKQHTKIWSDREFAGWSLAYILTKFYNWDAYLFISKQSSEYKACLQNFKTDKTYHVWKQPNIAIKNVFDVDDDKDQITTLLKANEFGWGFSEQGWHTWITRFEYLKECNWNGAPAKKYDIDNNKPLFLKTKFTNYTDYDSHIIVFPPKKNKTASNSL
ncbi:hypothetical protein [Olleya sp. Bg11-27]|uniref:hypothetical protein n=1 Tax=Olleya sp. Bg11-27 TaxID=2058135 RepID=UPI000C317581|nr:hypothetical protein [Olleya sp. Bg11-27]AUC76309.1 hypothetical protein CW732_11790 [Olleya sp. Bg11-27]